MTNLSLQHELNRSISLTNTAHTEGDGLLWRYVYGGKPKPFFHPLCTPAGHTLSLFEPHDHVWHRGLWFAFKFVNKDNFWEENDPYGVQRTTLPPTIEHRPGGAIVVTSTLKWVAPSGDTVINESRRFTWSRFADDAYLIDFETTITPTVDVVLDRTIFTTWGGYGGLVFRGSRNWQNTRLLFSDGTTSDRPIGYPATWCDLSGMIDGGLKQTGGIAMFDVATNVRHPSPWYGATGAGHYFNAAMLFHEPLSLAKGTPLALRYGVVVHDGIWDKGRLQAGYEQYVKSL